MAGRKRSAATVTSGSGCPSSFASGKLEPSNKLSLSQRPSDALTPWVRLVRWRSNGNRMLYVKISGTPPIFESVDRLASRKKNQDNTKEMRHAIKKHYECQRDTFIIVGVKAKYVNRVVPALNRMDGVSTVSAAQFVVYLDISEASTRIAPLSSRDTVRWQVREVRMRRVWMMREAGRGPKGTGSDARRRTWFRSGLAVLKAGVG
jgi:hypothetical protein